jgi:hypothetical protein
MKLSELVWAFREKYLVFGWLHVNRNDLVEVRQGVQPFNGISGSLIG